jgi:hypothetical protein
VNGWRGILVATVLLWFGAVLQGSVAPQIRIGNAYPDFLLVFLSLMCLFTTTSGATILGFFTGLMTGAPAGANLGPHIISRTIAGHVDGWVGAIGFQPNAFWAGVNTLIVTVVAHLLQMFLAPPPGIPAFLAATIASAVYNGVLAMPLYLLLRRILSPKGA